VPLFLVLQFGSRTGQVARLGGTADGPDSLRRLHQPNRAALEGLGRRQLPARIKRPGP
jgi:hypothetical protein